MLTAFNNVKPKTLKKHAESRNQSIQKFNITGTIPKQNKDRLRTPRHLIERVNIYLNKGIKGNSITDLLTLDMRHSPMLDPVNLTLE